MSLLQRSQASEHFAGLAARAGGPGHTGFISDLLLGCGRGDEDAFALLFETFHPLAYAITATHGLTQDIDGSVQVAFVTIWEDSPLYSPGTESSVSWIMRHLVAATQTLQEAPSPVSSDR